MRALSGLMEPTGGGRGHDLFLIFGRVDNVNTPRRAQLERLFTILTVKTKAVAGRPPFPQANQSSSHMKYVNGSAW